VLLAIGLTAIYRRGREAGKPCSVRACASASGSQSLPASRVFSSITPWEPMPLNLVAKQIIFETFSTVLLGLTLAGLNKQTA